MAEKREPYVEGHRVDSSVSTTVSDSRVNVYVGIEADTGTYDLTYQQTPKLFVQEYSTKAKPDTNDASTLLHAGKLVESFGIYVKRVNKDAILPGIVSTSKFGEVGYFDTNYNLISNLTEFKISPFIEKVNEQKLAIVIDNVLYINSNIEDTADLVSQFSNEVGPTYTVKDGEFISEPSPMSEAIDSSGVDVYKENAGIYKITKTEGDVTKLLFYVINLGNVYNVEEFLNKVASYAKNYRSDADKSEFIRYESDSLMMSIDISGCDEGSKADPVQACKTLKNSSRLAKALTKIEFTEGDEDESLLTNTDFYSKNDTGIKCLDISGFRYYPQILNDNHNYADSIVTLKPSKFGVMNNAFDPNNCSISDGILSSIDTMLTESDTIKPDSTYCSTEQVFKLNIGKVSEQSVEGISLVPSIPVTVKNKKTGEEEEYLCKTGFFGEGFESSLIKLYVLDINGDWIPFEGETQVSNFYIDNVGYAYIKIDFDGQMNDVSEVDAGFCLLYKTFNQGSTSEQEDTGHAFILGKNVDKSSIIPNGYDLVSGLTSNTIEVKNISSNTTDLGIICSLSHCSFGNSDYAFSKVTEEEYAGSPDIPGSGSSSGSEVSIAVTPSRIHKLYMYFLNNRNITFGITGYDERCWKKYATVMQRNYTFESQDSVSAGIPGYHAILIDDVLYYNGTLGDTKGEGPNIPDDWSYDNEVQVATIALIAKDFVIQLEQYLRNNFKLIARMSDGSYMIGETIDEDSIKYTPSLVIEDFMNVNQDEDFSNARYAIIQKFTSSAKLFSIDLSFDKTDKEIIKFVNSYNGTEYTDKISFNVGKIDGYGTNISYKSYNLFDGRSFFVKELNEEAPVIEMSVSSFGDDIKPKKATSMDYVNALDDLITDEFKPSFLWDAGLCQTDYTNALTSLANTTYSMVPISVPKTAESAADVKAWKSAFNVDNPVQYILDGWHYNTVFGDISFECCPTYYYLVGKLSNANSITKEFQPMFYKTRGIVSAGVPVRNIPLTKKEREELLDLRVNSIVRNKANSISYINQNFTNQQVESDFSEEQNVCISNEVCRSCDSYADNNIISKNNTPNLRAQVTSELTNILRSRILESRGDDTARSFYVECNDVNNPKAIIDARKIVIDVYVTYNKSINAVLIYSRTKSLDQG